MEGKGAWDNEKYDKVSWNIHFLHSSRYVKNQKVMIDLWNQIAEIADFDKVRLNQQLISFD